tara:strand:+ start:2145 stop:3293 length:1149 start_codon:yes stop_codon:yes gene_type:complete
MLEQAIIDAEQLKETAQRTAEEAVIEKYQSEIKEAVSQILEQDETLEEDEAALVVDEGEVSLVDELPSAQLMDEEEVIEINLDQLEELMAQAMEENEVDASDMTDRHEVAQEISAMTEDNTLDEEIELDEDINDLLEEEDLDEEIDIDEAEIMEVIKSVLSEELGPDLKDEETVEEVADTSTAPVDTLEEAEELEEEKVKNPGKYIKGPRTKAGVDDDGDGVPNKADKDPKDGAVKESRLLQKENKSLLREQKKMNNKVQLLENKVQKYGTVIEQLKQKLDESNLSNAKLLYQNRILNSISLNERQKDKIVEAISNATTVEEAKIIFETLQSAVGIKSKKTRKQESLNEVVTRSSSAFIPRKEVKPNTDAFSDRMKRLAGLK